MPSLERVLQSNSRWVMEFLYRSKSEEWLQTFIAPSVSHIEGINFLWLGFLIGGNAGNVLGFARSYMKRQIATFCSVLSLAQAYEGPAPIEVAEQVAIYVGVEALSGFRSDYVYRGEYVAESSIEFQISGGVALDDYWYMQGEFFYLNECESSPFRQTQLLGELNYYLNTESTLGYYVAGQDYDKSLLESGIEQGVVWRWNPSLNWGMMAKMLYDSGQEGAYAEMRATYMPLIAENLAWVNCAQVGCAINYADIDGIKELMLRTGLSWAVDESWKVEPYVAWYYGRGRDDFSQICAGFWLSYSF